MDNLPAHKGDAVRKLIEARRATSLRNVATAEDCRNLYFAPLGDEASMLPPFATHF
jgi:hypothetical protein